MLRTRCGTDTVTNSETYCISVVRFMVLNTKRLTVQLLVRYGSYRKRIPKRTSSCTDRVCTAPCTDTFILTIWFFVFEQYRSNQGTVIRLLYGLIRYPFIVLHESQRKT